MRWLLASAPLWALAGLLSPLIPPLVDSPVRGFHHFLNQVIGLPDQIAYRLAFAALQVPMIILLGVIVAAAQLLVLRGVRPWARRWMQAAAAGGAITSAAGWMVGSLVPLPMMNQGGDIWLLIFHYLLRGVLLGAFISIAQRWSMRERVLVPAWFVLASSLAGAAGAFGLLVLALSALGALR